MEVPSLSPQISREIISESFDIKQDNINYKFKIIITNNNITLNILNEKEIIKEYETKLTLEELKQKNKIFSMFNSCQEFLDYIKVLIENKKLSIKTTKENQIIIELIVEYLYKQNIIQLNLSQKQLNMNLIVKDLYNKISTLNEKYTKLIEENNITKEQIKSIREENKNIREENKNLKEENMKLNEKLKMLIDDIKNLKEENNNVKNKIKNMEELINKINNGKSDVKEQNEINSFLQNID